MGTLTWPEHLTVVAWEAPQGGIQQRMYEAGTPPESLWQQLRTAAFPIQGEWEWNEFATRSAINEHLAGLGLAWYWWSEPGRPGPTMVAMSKISSDVARLAPHLHRLELWVEPALPLDAQEQALRTNHMHGTLWDILSPLQSLHLTGLSITYRAIDLHSLRMISTTWPSLDTLHLWTGSFLYLQESDLSAVDIRDSISPLTALRDLAVEVDWRACVTEKLTLHADLDVLRVPALRSRTMSHQAYDLYTLASEDGGTHWGGARHWLKIGGRSLRKIWIHIGDREREDGWTSESSYHREFNLPVPLVHVDAAQRWWDHEEDEDMMDPETMMPLAQSQFLTWVVFHFPEELDVPSSNASPV